MKESFSVDSLVLPPGEHTKSLSSIEKIIQILLDSNIERNSVLISLGGGVIGDLTGFASSIILRGVNFVQIPTTLLAQIDSAIGGKTGINTPQGKNLVGTFYQPKAVISDINSLKSLPQRQLISGYAEICKYGLIGDKSFWEWLERNGSLILDNKPDEVTYAIKKSCLIKAKIVAEDEHERNKRALLNLGHTFAHALESHLSYSEELLHGEAVSIGIIMAFKLSEKLGYCSEQDCERVKKHFELANLPIKNKSIYQSKDINRIIEKMKQDKKVKKGKLTFVLVRGIGEAFIEEDVGISKVKQTLEEFIN